MPGRYVPSAEVSYFAANDNVLPSRSTLGPCHILFLLRTADAVSVGSSHSQSVPILPRKININTWS